MSKVCLLLRWQNQVSRQSWDMGSPSLWGKPRGGANVATLWSSNPQIILKMWPHSSTTCGEALTFLVGKPEPFTSQTTLYPAPHLHPAWTCSALHSTPWCVYRVALSVACTAWAAGPAHPFYYHWPTLSNLGGLSHFSTTLKHRRAPVLGSTGREVPSSPLPPRSSYRILTDVTA